MITRYCMSPTSLTRRRLIALGAGAAAGLAGLAPRPAAAALKLDVTQGNVRRRPSARRESLPGGGGEPAAGGPPPPADPAMARGIAQIIASNLQRSGLFAPIDPAAYIEKISNI